MGAPGLERTEVFLSASAFQPHRHDTYAVGITTAGVQTFRYRGAQRVCLPGQVHILHPDEVHDGAPGTAEGFGYRILYIAPALIRGALVGGPLPFVAEPIQHEAPVTGLVSKLLGNLAEPVSDLALAEIAVGVADMLGRLGGERTRSWAPIDTRAVELARAYLTAHAEEPTPASAIERLTGLDRFTMARHFRRAFGTSPDRFRTLRRLALARAAIEQGRPLAEAAAQAGFADQSHMTRQFKQTYGLTPAQWAAATAWGGARPSTGKPAP
ncbi:MAG TPA: AraC family transcriptional regulator [Bacillota bacterium]|nr:AraC family transcriptional regulator [Bacillota bacterium]